MFKRLIFYPAAVVVLCLHGCVVAPSEERMPVAKVAAEELQNAQLPFLTTDASGKTFLSYVVEDDAAARLFVRPLEGDSWGAPVQVASGSDWFVNWADYPSVISWGDGRMAAHWLQKNGPGGVDYQVKISRSADNGTTWTSPVTLHSDTLPREHGFVSLVPFPSGRMFASWLDGRKYPSGDEGEGHGGEHDLHYEMTLMGGYVAEDGTVEAEEVLDSRVCDCCQTASVLSGHGLVTFYRDRSESEVRDIAEVMWTENGWTEPAILSEDKWEIKACPVNGPQADAIDEQVAVVWFTAANDEPKVQLSLSDEGGKHLSVPIKVSHKATAGRADVKLINKDFVAVSWIELVDGKGLLKVAVFTIDGQRREEWAVADIATTRQSGFPQLTSDGKQLVLAWTTEKGIETAVIELTDLGKS